MSQTESGVAEQMVGMSIRAMESISRLLASGAKNLAVFLFTIARNTKPYRGVAGVKSLLDGGHELKTLELDRKELHEFCRHAKRNDFPCSIIHDKRLYQDKVPVLLRAVDAARANRVVELMRLNQPSQEREIAQERDVTQGQETTQGQKITPEQETIQASQNPTNGRRVSRTWSSHPPSENVYSASDSIDGISPSDFHPSVRGRIHELQRARNISWEQTVQPTLEPTPQPRVPDMRDERMMEALRQFMATMTAISQDVQDVKEDPLRENVVPIPSRNQTMTESPARETVKADPSITPSAAQPRRSVRLRMADIKQRQETSATSRTPTLTPRPSPGRGGPSKGGR